MRHADAVREDEVLQDRARRAGVRIEADDAAVAARFQAVDRPVVHLVADRRLAEEDAAVGRDVEIVGEPQAGIVDDREPRAVGLVGELLDLAVAA